MPLADFTLSTYKRPNEEFVVAVDFVNVLGSDTISSKSVTATRTDTGADVTTTFIESSAISGTQVQAKVQAGTAETDVDVTFQATTAAGYVWERVVRVPVRA